MSWGRGQGKADAAVSIVVDLELCLGCVEAITNTEKLGQLPKPIKVSAKRDLISLQKRPTNTLPTQGVFSITTAANPGEGFGPKVIPCVKSVSKETCK